MNMMNDFEIVFSVTETIIWVESNNKATTKQRWSKLNVQRILSYENFTFPKSFVRIFSPKKYTHCGDFNPIENTSKCGLFQVKGENQHVFKITREKVKDENESLLTSFLFIWQNSTREKHGSWTTRPESVGEKQLL